MIVNFHFTIQVCFVISLNFTLAINISLFGTSSSAIHVLLNFVLKISIVSTIQLLALESRFM